MGGQNAYSRPLFRRADFEFWPAK